MAKKVAEFTGQVKATQAGFYGKYREAGDAFVIENEAAFSKNWMQYVDPNAPVVEPQPEPESELA